MVISLSRVKEIAVACSSVCKSVKEIAVACSSVCKSIFLCGKDDFTNIETPPEGL